MRFLIADGIIADCGGINLNHLIIRPSFRTTQKVWYGYGGIPLFSENLLQLNEQFELLRLPFPEAWINQRELFRLTKRMLNKNKFFRSGYIQFQVLWMEENSHTLVTSFAVETFDFPFSNSGLLATISTQKKRSRNFFNRFPGCNEMIWQAGRAEIHRSPYQQVIFMNEDHSVCEGDHANIFLIKDGELITPDLSTGCYEDVLRSYVIEAASQTGLKISEPDTIEESKLFGMDEVFFASEGSGIQWVLGIGSKRYLHHYSKLVHEKICLILKEKARH